MTYHHPPTVISVAAVRRGRATRSVSNHLPLLLLTIVLLLVAGRPIAAQLELECLEPEGVVEISAQYYVGVGNAYFRQIDYTNAIAAYTCALDLDAGYVPALVRRGYAFTIQGDEARALADYNRALELDDANVEAYTNRGVLYMREGNFGLAIGDFTLVIAFRPDEPVAYNNRAIAYAAEGSYDEALADLNTALELDPEYAQAHASLGALYTALAVQSYREYREISLGGDFRLPGRRPTDVIGAVEEDGVIREFDVWVPYLAPALD
jgi:tetratricopeptide (TPR) repeat protein